MTDDLELWADHADNDAEFWRIRGLPERVQRGLRRLVVRCPHNRLVLTVYEAVGGRWLAVSATPEIEWEWRRRTGRRHSQASWLHPEPDLRTGDVFPLRCDRGVYHVSVDLLIAAIPATGTRNVSVSSLGPSPAVQ